MSKENKQIYENIILNAIKQEDDAPKTNDPKKLLKYADNRFKSEYGYMIQRVGEQNARKEWLQGLAINIPYTNQEILEIAKKTGSLPQNPTEKQEQKILDNYWNFMSNKIGVMNRKYKIDQPNIKVTKVKTRQPLNMNKPVKVTQHKRNTGSIVRKHTRNKPTKNKLKKTL